LRWGSGYANIRVIVRGFANIGCMSAIAVDANSRIAGELIRKIREESDLSQAELARCAGMPRSVLSAYEHGHRQPAVAALARIAAAAGMEIGVGLPQAAGVDVDRAGEILTQVLDLAEQLPQRPRGELAYPPLNRLAA
jgi:transcriptional regulator with XRE-family HTH domain